MAIIDKQQTMQGLYPASYQTMGSTPVGQAPANYGGAPQSTTPSPSQQPQTAPTTPGLINGVTNAQYQNVDGVYRTVQSNETVQGQLQGILAQDSPLLRQARAKAMEGMADRGLVNSAMAQSAGQDAMYKSALQVATPDALAYGKAASENQKYGNETQQFNADAFNKNSEFNAKGLNEMGLRNAADKADMERTILVDAGQTKRQDSVNATNITTTRMNNDTAITTTGMNNRTQIETTGMNNATQMAAASMQAETSRYSANLSASTQMQISNNSLAQQSYLESSRQQHAEDMQTSGAANLLYQHVAQNSSAILTNPDLDGPTRERLLQAQRDIFDNGAMIAGSAARL
jgi:hypothetical protein